MNRLVRTALGLTAVVCALVGTLWLLVLSYDTGELKSALLTALHNRTDSNWSIDGPVRIKMGLHPTVVIENVRASNPDWATHTDLIIAQQLTGETRWGSVLSGVPQIHRIDLRGVRLNLETDEEGQKSWGGFFSLKPGLEASSVASEVIIAPNTAIQVTELEVLFRSGWGDSENVYSIDQLDVAMEDFTVPLQVSLAGVISDRPFAVSGQIGSIERITAGSAYDVSLDGIYDGVESDATIAIDGRVASAEQMRLTLTVKADSLNDVDSISGIKLPRDTPVSIKVVAANNGSGITLQDYTLRIGQAIIRPGS